MSKEKETAKNEKDSKESENQDYKIINKEEKNSAVVLEVELPYSALEGHREKAITVLGKDIEVKGFRKGAAPANMIEKEIGEAKIIEETAYQAIVNSLPEIVVNEKINALTQPKISITKIAAGNPLTFKAEFVLMPEIDLADYKKIAKEVKAPEEVKVEDTEIDEYIDYIRSSRAEADALKKKTSADPKVREEANKKDGAEKKEGDKNKDDSGENKDNKKSEPELPELDDEFVKTLGDFKNVEDFKKQLRENMLKDKKQKEDQKRRLEIIEKIISESKIDLPDILIDEELQRMLQQFKGDLAQAKMEFPEYLKQINKSEEDLLKEWRPDAIKRTKMNLILPKIASEEKIEAAAEKVEHEVKHLKQHYPDISDEEAKSYVSHMLRNDAVFAFLESIK
jgi:trigger factor